MKDDIAKVIGAPSESINGQLNEIFERLRKIEIRVGRGERHEAGE